MTNPYQPDLGVGVSFPQVIRGDNCVLAYGPATALYIDGDAIPNMVFLHLPSDVPLVYLVAQAGRLLSGAIRRRGVPGGLSGRLGVYVSHSTPPQNYSHAD